MLRTIFFLPSINPGLWERPSCELGPPPFNQKKGHTFHPGAPAPPFPGPPVGPPARQPSTELYVLFFEPSVRVAPPSPRRSLTAALNLLSVLPYFLSTTSERFLFPRNPNKKPLHACSFPLLFFRSPPDPPSRTPAVYGRCHPIRDDCLTFTPLRTVFLSSLLWRRHSSPISKPSPPPVQARIGK